MPVADLGYRHWEGKRVSSLWRWLAITRNDFGIAYRSSKLLRRFLVVAWMPLIYFAPVFFAVGWIADPANDLNESIFRNMFSDEASKQAVAVLRSSPETVLPLVWAIAFYIFLAIPQAYLSMLIIAIVAPPLVARDLKHKAFLLYFSKPIGAWEYVLGKLAVAVTFNFLITLLPALVLYVISIALSPNFDTVVATAPIILRIVLTSVVISVPISMVALCLSSLTKSPRVAAFSWIALSVVGEFAYRLLTTNMSRQQDFQPSPWAFLLSIREMTTRAAGALFDLSGQATGMVNTLQGVDVGDLTTSIFDRTDSGPLAYAFLQATGQGGGGAWSPWIAVIALACIAMFCAVIVVRRVLKPVRV